MPKSVFTEAYATFLAELVAIRKRAGVSQVELARRLGATQQFVSRAERGDRRLDVVEYYAIVRALELEPREVFVALIDKLPRAVKI
jgi:transcriptional regulator with XRE-family HTH domain